MLNFLSTTGLKNLYSLESNGFKSNNIYSFCTKTSSVIKPEGLGYSFNNLPSGNKYVDKDRICQFPLFYKHFYSSTFYVKFDLSSISAVFSCALNVYQLNKVDGCCIIKTPYTGYQNTLSFKTNVATYDNILVSGFPIVAERKSMEYIWLPSTVNILDLEIIGSEHAGAYSFTAIKYRDTQWWPMYIFKTDKLNASIYPYSTSNHISIKLPSTGNYHSILYSLVGLKMIEFDFCSIDIDFYLSNYSDGLCDMKIVYNDSNEKSDLLNINKINC